MQHTRSLTAMLLASLALACGDDEVTPTPDAGPRDTGVVGTGDSGVPDRTLVEAATESGLTSLVAALETAGLTETLSGPGPFTVFAPDEAAFSAAGALPTDPALLANLLLYHVLPFEADAAAVLQGTPLRSAAGLRLPVDATATPATVGGAGLTTVDVRARNGVAHVIDRVLTLPNVPEVVAATVDTSTLARVVGLASQSVRDALAAPGPITVFAPVNSAFDAIDSGTILNDPTFLDEVLTFHVTQGQALAGDLQNGQTLTMANGQTLTVQLGAGGVVILTDAASRTVRVVESDIRVANGVVHLIDQVLLPARDAVGIVDTLRRNNFNTLATAIGTANLGAALAGMPSTVFAPTDAAFAALGSPLPTDPSLLANIILNHVTPGALSTATLSMRGTVPANTGLEILLDFGADPPTVGAASLTRARDIVSTDGIVHGIDQVLLPPTIAVATELFTDLSTLNAAVAAASPSIGATLAGTDAITVFAPVNAAFAGLDLTALTADVPRLDDLLAFHVSPGQTLAGELTDGQTLTMSNGQPLTVRVNGDVVTLVDGVGASVRVIQSDIRLSNGVVHLIDAVLSPGHIVDQARANGLTELVAAAGRAGLAPTLVAGGPFTVFAPTDAAFGALATALNVDLTTLSPEVTGNILLHHLVNGTRGSGTLMGGTSLINALGLPLAITSTQGQLRVAGVPLGTPIDVSASNGIIHVVDQVLVPPTIGEVAATRADLTTALTALGRASAAVAARFGPNVLGRDRPATVFLPVNSAFMNQNVDPTTMTAAMLDPVLNHHVIPAQLAPSAFTSSTQRFGTFNGTLTINVDLAQRITVVDAAGNPAANVIAQFGTLNGWVYVIDRVLFSR